ncbi:MAG: hypothetical protein U0271_38640 [Polyangiaceae bacterium]
MSRAKASTSKAGGAPKDLDGALAAFSAEALREIVHEVLRELDDLSRARVVGRARLGSAGRRKSTQGTCSFRSSQNSSDSVSTTISTSATQSQSNHS